MMKIKPCRYKRSYSSDKVKDKDEINAAWDTETDGLNGILQCITYSIDGRGQLFSGPNQIKDFIDVLFENPYPVVWFAHNAQYDWRYIIKYFMDNDYYMEFLNRTDSDIFQIVIWTYLPTGNSKFDRVIPKIVMRDSMALFPEGLADFVMYYAPGYQKMDIDLDHVRFDLSNPIHREYAINDSVILRAAMDGFTHSFYDLFGCKPALTTAGSALKAWQNTLGNNEFYCLKKEDEEYIESAYYGGLVFLTSTALHRNCKTYDINSSYPSQMVDHEMPYGTPARTKEIDFFKLGIYTVRVKAPENLQIPILPSRDDKGDMIWRRGEFDTTVTSVELEFALLMGYKLIEVLDGMIFPYKCKPFDEFIGKCKALRLEYKGTAVEKTAKLMQNSLYGKFGAKKIRDQIYMPLNEDDLETGYCADSELGLWIREVEDHQMARLPHWSAFITAYGRLDLLTTAYAIGPKNVIYGDTDSLTMTADADTRHIPQHESEYGYFKLEKTWLEFKAVAPKVYTGIIDKTENGKIPHGAYAGKAKGIPKKWVDDKILQQIHNGIKIKVEYQSTPKLTAILKGKAESGTGQTERQRTLSSLEKSAHWESEGTNVRPKVAS